jgi:hypothetical protein
MFAASNYVGTPKQWAIERRYNGHLVPILIPAVLSEAAKRNLGTGVSALVTGKKG